MNRIYTIVSSALLLAACAAPQPHLTQDARLELDPKNPPADLKSTRVSEDEWKKQAGELCARPDFQCIQTPIDVSLIKEDGSTYHMTASPPMMTIQNGGSIYILAGQTLNVEADVVDGKLTNMHLVQTVAHPEKTLIVKLVQADKPTKALNMMLTVHNPFDKPLKYSAGMMLLTGCAARNTPGTWCSSIA